MSMPERPAAPPTTAWEMYRAMVGVGLVCGLLIVSAYVLTGPRIAHNRAEALRAAIFRVLPGARTLRPFHADVAGRLAAGEGAPTIHAAYDADGALLGVAIPAEGLGYQDVIRILYAYAPEANAVVGIEVLDSRDTPGLGDRIASDPAFLDNFRHLDVGLAPDGAALAHPVTAVKHGTKTAPWQVDTITGATISSTAVATMLNASAAVWAPRIRRDLAALRAPE